MPTHSRWLAIGAASLSVTMALSACGGRSDDDSGSTGGTSEGGGSTAATVVPTEGCPTDPTAVIEGDTIKIGSSVPQSGLYSGFGEISKGWSAYFEYVNAEGGVDGKQIETVILDDEYDPNKTVTNAQKLVQDDQVMALFNVVGTANNKGVREFTDPQCVPNMYLATGSQLWGDDVEEFQWTIGSIPTNPTEAAEFATYLEEENPDAKVAVLYQADDFGEGYLEAFKTAIEGTDIEVVAEEGLEPGGTPDPAVATLADSEADTFLAAVTTVTCPNTLKAAQDLGWDALTYISATCASNTILNLAPEGSKSNLITSLYVKAPDDPQWADDPAVMEFRELGAEYGLTEEELNNGVVAYGWAMGELMTKTLEQAAESGGISRSSVMEASRNLEDVRLEILLPGVMANSKGFEDPFVIEAMQIGKYDEAQKIFELQGELQDFEGRTGEYSPGD